MPKLSVIIPIYNTEKFIERGIIEIAPLAYINDVEKTNREVSEKNDMKIKEKQETAKNTKVVYCPFCGGDNIIVGKTGKCKYCRKSIS